jgi:hypothetical protein
MITGFTVRIDLGDMVIWNEVFAHDSQSALEIVAKEKLSIGDHTIIDSEFLNSLSDVVVSELPMSASVSNAQLSLGEKEVYIDIISNNLKTKAL